jgi:hypothetical protein
MCKMFYKFVKNESYLIFINICKPNLGYFSSILQKIDFDCKKLVVPKYFD